MASATRIKRKFRELRARGEAALIPFIVAGDPDMDTTRKLVLELEARGARLIELRAQTQIPIILFGYYNPIFHYGCERLCADAARAGIDALLVIDLPPEESGELKKPARANGLDLIYLLAPTTPINRSRAIARSASGFLYYVSVTGVTGARAH